ncbi:hypothetical protein GIS00_06945 [Nakamurella sp. YIM 132087]|uniref:Anti-sigma factor n=1 Tax=Nakamurella alba TaxID=2665158 RepID=A0A7K1FHU8_9ACTN|nr:hypothetical protein [Nakamurella alba]MTD13678.1 hypothetical protein [Nakamurella alba]
MTGVFEDHLGVDAVVAYVDGELGLTAFQRAAAHIGRCPDCAAQVAEQTVAQQTLRSADLPRMSGSLFDQLRSIPVAVPAVPTVSVPGLVRDSRGHVRHDREPVGAGQGGRSRRFRFGAGALVAGLAVGALVAGSADSAPDATSPDTVTTIPGAPVDGTLPGFQPVSHR